MKTLIALVALVLTLPLSAEAQYAYQADRRIEAVAGLAIPLNAEMSIGNVSGSLDMGTTFAATMSAQWRTFKGLYLGVNVSLGTWTDASEESSLGVLCTFGPALRYEHAFGNLAVFGETGLSFAAGSLDSLTGIGWQNTTLVGVSYRVSLDIQLVASVGISVMNTTLLSATDEYDNPLDTDPSLFQVDMPMRLGAVFDF